MPIRQRSVPPKKGDDVEYDGGHFILTFRQGKPHVFFDGRYIEIKGELFPHPRGKGWIVKDEPRSTNLIEYNVAIRLGTETKVVRVPAKTPGSAKNSAVNKVAHELNMSIQQLYSQLKLIPDSIKVSTV